LEPRIPPAAADPAARFPGDAPASLVPVQQDVTGSGAARQAMLGSGTQLNYFGGTRAAVEAAVSISLPAGRRDERFPLRGREQLLNDLESVGQGPGVRVVHGMGGSGKTSLALEVAWRAQRRGVEVWWVTAADADRLGAGMRALGRRLGVADEELHHGEAADLLWHRLSVLRRDWLLVIDNADEQQALAGPGERIADGTGWLRPVDSAAGMVLVTSRDGRAASWGPWCRLHRLGMLTGVDAGRVIADHAARYHQELGGDAEARELADRLGRLPLALRIAGSFLAESAAIPPAFTSQEQVRSYRQYRQLIEDGQVDIAFPAADTGDLTADQARGLIRRTWDLTLDLLEARRMPEARRLLQLLACLANAPIPHELLLHPPTLANSPEFTGLTGPRLWQVLLALAGFGLIDVTAARDGAPALIRLHPLVRDTSRPGPGGDYSERAYLALAAVLLHRAAASEDVGSPDDPAKWPIWQVLVPHALHVFQRLSGDAASPMHEVVSATYAASRVAQYQAQRGLSVAAEATQQAVLAVRQQALGANHPDTINARYEIAEAIRMQGDYARAIAAHRDVLEAQRRILGPEHPDTLVTQHNVAAVMSFQGHYAQAEAEYRHVLGVEIRVLGPDHPNVLSTQHEIARMIGEQGNYADAETRFRNVLTRNLRVRGPEHPATLVTRSQIARMVAAQGDYARAEAELRDVFGAQLTVLGPDHPRTLWTRHEIARMMAAQGDHAGAEEEYRDVLAHRLRLLPYHPDTLSTRHEIARMIAAQGDQPRAEAEFLDVLAAKTRALGPNHPSTLLTAREISALQHRPNE
jgi:tetratricopeptide (TPR) repeat protein